MADTAELIGALRSAVEHVGKAQTATSAAEQATARVQAQLAATGFKGIAARLGPVRKSLTESAGQQSNVARSVAGCVQQVSAIGDDTTPQEVVAHLAPIGSQLDSTMSTIKGVAQSLAHLEQQVTQILAGGQPGQLKAAIHRPRAILMPPVTGLLSSAKKLSETLTADARKAGSTAGPN